jgi:hypothetical protein
MAEWSKDHVVAIGPLTSNSGLITITWLKWRPGRATRGKGRQLVGKVRKCVCGKPDLQGCIPRLCRLRTIRLAPRASVEGTDRMPVIWAR